MPELLTGTVTFLFSDIEGSTRLLQSRAAGWPALLARHQELLRAAFEVEGGREAGTEGDSFFVAFPTAPGAVAAAIGAQRALAAEPWPPEAEVRVRIGLHTGDADLGVEGYVGLHVHRASRIAGVGRGGQVLISEATRILVDGTLPEGIELRDLGEHRLKDLERPEHLWQLVIPGLQNDFPPIISLDAVPNTLPTRLTTFLGREHEIAEVTDLLGRSRLLTLTGPGGTSKTRLSLEVARRALARHPGGVFFVELAPIAEPELVVPTIAQTMGLPDRGGRSAIDRLVDHIGERAVLLVLDNFEQVVGAAPTLSALLAACPNLTMLTSSRAVLHVSGEQEYPVPPLGVPDPAHLPPLAQLSQYEAVALFIERARAVSPSFEVTNENAPAVAEISVRLDGLPLAIELAAARIRILTPEAMLGRLDHRLGLLAGGSRDLPLRQQTLRGAIDWSHDLLDEPDRALFACLSVFVGTAGLEPIERVCGGEVSGDLLDVLASLIDKSLVRQRAGHAGEPRFSMLETIREFAIERAVEGGRWDELRARHAGLFVEVAEAARDRVMGPEKRHWLDRLEEEHGNLRSAMSWAIETRNADVAMRLGAALWRFWQMRGYLAEGLERMRVALAMPGASGPTETRARALDAAAGLAYWQGNQPAARAFYAEELEAWRGLGDERGTADTLYAITFSYTYDEQGSLTPEGREEVAAFIEEALEIYRRLADQAGIARCLWAKANSRYSVRDGLGARELSMEARDIFRREGDRFMEAWSLFTASYGLLITPDRSKPSPEAIGIAVEELRETLKIFHEAGDVSGYTLVLDAIAACLSLRGDDARAAVIFGAVEELQRTSGTGLNIQNRTLVGFQPEPLRDDPATADAYRRGRDLGPDQAVAYALEETA